MNITLTEARCSLEGSTRWSNRSTAGASPAGNGSCLVVLLSEGLLRVQRSTFKWLSVYWLALLEHLVGVIETD